MREIYNEELPTDLAKILVGEKYDSKYKYRIIHDEEGSYVTGYDPETGEKVDLAFREDGIPDDLELGVEEFEFVEEELLNIDNGDYTIKAFGKWLILVPLSLMVTVASVVMCYILIK